MDGRSNPLNFTFSDTIAGYVTAFDRERNLATLETTDGRLFDVKLTVEAYAEVIRNLGEPWQDTGMSIPDLFTPGRYLFVYGVFYPEGQGVSFEAKHIVVVGRDPHEYRFEAADWWVNQIRGLAEFYMRGQFPDGNIDFGQYRTHLTVEGQKIDSTRQETDTISRMIYGFASAFMLTGVDKYLDIAEAGTRYLRQHMQARAGDDMVYWYHGMDVRGGRERKILASEFGDDYDAIPAYEQIYALAGPVQTLHANGDPEIVRDATMTANLFERYFLDADQGGYFSHIDPVDFDPRHPSLTHNQARKNWNSVGDHAPAYLINLYIATGDERWLTMLEYTADSIADHMPDYDRSPFMQEKFHEDWSEDHDTPLQKNRAIVGHNMKVAWNLTRAYNVLPKEKYRDFAFKIAEVMPGAGMDKQRGGLYDMVERYTEPGEEFHRLIWHDRKAWWQQEQAILAYMIMAGTFGSPEYIKYAREFTSFYNAWFPDNDSGGVYFNVLGTGIPYLLGTERLKGSHSMSGYHSFELCYLAATYSNLLVTKQSMDFWYRPVAGALQDRILRVAPDLLPPGSVKIGEVWINGRRHTDFDAAALTVRLPDEAAYESDHPLSVRPTWMGDPRMLPDTTSNCMKVRVRLVPVEVGFDMIVDTSADATVLTLAGTLDDEHEPALVAQLDKIVAVRPATLVLRVENLDTIAPRAARAISFVRQKMDLEQNVIIVGANGNVRRAFEDIGVWEEFNAVEDYEQD